MCRDDAGCAVPAGDEVGGVVHGGARARLDPAHAQRIVAITDDGDQGLIALAACQAYVREVSHFVVHFHQAENVLPGGAQLQIQLLDFVLIHPELVSACIERRRAFLWMT